jgi:hypothetical protein
VTELVESGMGAEEATAQAQQEYSAEEENAVAAINADMESQLKAAADAHLSNIKNRWVKCKCCRIVHMLLYIIFFIHHLLFPSFSHFFHSTSTFFYISGRRMRQAGWKIV